MTVLHIIEPFAGGVTTFLVHITKVLNQHQHVVLHGSRTTADRMDLVRKRFPNTVNFAVWEHVQREINPIADIRALIFLLRFLRQQKFDVVHLHSAKAGILGRVACFLLNIRHVIYTPHATPFLRKDISRLTRRFFIFLEQFSSRLGGVITCCCLSELEAFQANNISAIAINNGTSLSAFHKPQYREQKITVMFSAFLTEQKNPKLFNAIAERFINNKDVQFFWVGDGHLRHEITSPNITVTGWLQASEVERYFERTMIYLSSSAWEGLPYSVLEAMNYECCLLLTDCDGHRDVIVQGKNGFLYRTVDEAVMYLNQLLQDPSEIYRMGKASKQICSEKFEAEKMAKAYNKLYYKDLT